MEKQEKQLSEKESLALIAMMINKAKDAYRATGAGAILWGTVIAICSFVRLAELQFAFTLPFDIYLLTLVALIPQIIISVKEKKERKVRSYDEVFIDRIWLAFGVCIFLLILIVNNVSAGLQPMVNDYEGLVKGRADRADFNFSEYVAPMFLLLYGFPTFVTGSACKFTPMAIGGIFCWVCCIVTIYTPVRMDLLLTACAAILAWFVPGIMMLREYRRYKKSQVAANV